MIRSVRVGSATGLHARVAARVAAVAATTGRPVTVRRPHGTPMPADSVLSLLTLGAPGGTELLVEADDPATLAAVAAAIETPLDEVARG